MAAKAGDTSFVAGALPGATARTAPTTLALVPADVVAAGAGEGWPPFTVPRTLALAPDGTIGVATVEPPGVDFRTSATRNSTITTATPSVSIWVRTMPSS